MLSRVVNFWLFLTMGTFVAAISLGVLSGFDLSNLNPFENSELQQGFLEWVIPKLSIWMFFGLLYKVTPNTFVPAKSAAIGAIVSATLFTVASNFYGVFATKFTSYQAVYGALAAIPLFLMWLYLIWVIILVGGVVTSRSMVGFDLEQTEKDLQVVASSSLEKHRDHQLQESLPLVLLLLIYKEFAKAIGHGLSLNNLRKSSHLPESWLIEGLDILEQMGFIVKTSKVVDDFSGESVEYFPAFPSESLLIKDVIHKFRSEAAAWLQRWHEQLGINHQSIIDVYWRRKSDLAEATTMRDLVNAGTG